MSYIVFKWAKMRNISCSVQGGLGILIWGEGRGVGVCFDFVFYFFFVNIHFEALPSLLRWKAWTGKQLGNLQHTEALETPLLTKKANWEIKEKENIDFMWSTWTERAEVDFPFSYYRHFNACFYLILTEQ